RGLLEAEHQVRAARLEPGQVDRDVEVPELTEPPNDRLVTPALPQPRDLVQRNLETRQAIVMADAELAEAERAQEFLGGVDLPELLRSNAVAVLETRRETGERRLVPRRQREPPRELANLRLRQLGLDQRSANPALPSRLHAGPVVPQV